MRMTFVLHIFFVVKRLEAREAPHNITGISTLGRETLGVCEIQITSEVLDSRCVGDSQWRGEGSVGIEGVCVCHINVSYVYKGAI